MNIAPAYFAGIEPAAIGLFNLLNGYAWQKMKALAALMNGSSEQEFSQRQAAFESIDVAREVVSGSILQIAYFAIKRHGVPRTKSPNALHFESEMNRLLRESTKPRVKRLELPAEFCVGREVGHLPIGMLIYAGRNQYNHFDDDRLGVVNEVVFNHLEQIFPEPTNGRSFKVLRVGRPLSYSIVSALGWLDHRNGTGFDAFKKDMLDILLTEC